MPPSPRTETNEAIHRLVMERLDAVVDPCMEAAGLNLSLVGLGIVRNVEVQNDVISVELGLTEPGCGFTHALVIKVEDALADLGESFELRTSFNWTEPWTEAMMTESGKQVFNSARKRGLGMLSRFNAHGDANSIP